MAIYTGVTGKISIKKGEGSAKDIAHMNNFSVELTKEIVSVPSFGRDTREKAPGIKDWTASAEGTADFDEGSNQRDLVQAYEDGTMVEATFYLAEGVFMQGDALIESLSISHSAENQADISINLSGSGSVTFMYDGEV